MSAALIREAIGRIADGDANGSGARILRDLDGLTPGMIRMVQAKAREVADFADLMAHAEAHNAPIFAADPSRRI